MKLEWAAPNRNREPILAVLRDVLPATGTVLEVASGTGQHAAWFGGQLHGLDWQPSDPDTAHLASIEAWRTDAGRNVLPAIRLDVHDRPWPIVRADAVVCINLVHVCPWETTLALLDGAVPVVPKGGPLLLYGPYRVGGRHVSESNAAFDADLRARNAAWGVRDLEQVVAAAVGRGWAHARTVEMPANNCTVVFCRR